MSRVGGIARSVLVVLSAGLLAGCASPPNDAARDSVERAGPPFESGDGELARLLVQLELRARRIIAEHYRDADEAHRAWLAQRRLLPTTVADAVFYATVPELTGRRAWVKMIVDEPRSLHNLGDSVANAMLEEIKRGKTSVAWRTRDAYYYAEPIKAEKECLLCHGQPKGEPDPFFPQYTKNGWEEGQTVGAVVARVGQTAQQWYYSGKAEQ